MPDLIGVRLGNYEIIDLLGEGGMAAVYRARQLNIKRDVAIKVIKTGLKNMAEFSRRFEREAQTVAGLNHPHILKVFDYGQHEDMVYLVTELQPGGSLADMIRRGALPMDLVLRMVDQISSALDYAHEHGIIHRDLKPQNVLLDSKGNAILTDFGIAKVLTENTMTQTGTALGTPAYMAPEQWQGLPVDSRVDNYALGIMTFEMLSGKLPFQGDTPYSLMHMHVTTPPPNVRSIRADLPQSVEDVLIRSLAKDRNDRFASAGDFAYALRMAMSGQTPTGLKVGGGANVTAPLHIPTPLGTPVGQATAVGVEAKAGKSGGSRAPLLLVALALIAVVAVAAIVLSQGGNQPPQATQTNLPSTSVVAVVPTTAAPQAQNTPTSGSGNTSGETPTSGPTLTPSITPTITANAETLAAQIVGARSSQTAEFAQREQTALAIANATVDSLDKANQTATANAIALFTATPLPPTITPSPVPPSVTPIPPTLTSTKPPATPIPPTKTWTPTVMPPTAPPVASGPTPIAMLDTGVAVRFIDHFNGSALDPTWIVWSDQPTVSGGQIVMKGKEDYGFGLSREGLREGQGYIILFKVDEGSSVQIKLESGEYEKPEYRAIGLLRGESDYEIFTAAGANAQIYIVQDPAPLKPDTWYYLMFAVGRRGVFGVQLWERGSKTFLLNHTGINPPGLLWNDRTWNTVIQTYQGTFTADAYAELDFSVGSRLPQTPWTIPGVEASGPANVTTAVAYQGTAKIEDGKAVDLTTGAISSNSADILTWSGQGVAPARWILWPNRARFAIVGTSEPSAQDCRIAPKRDIGLRASLMPAGTYVCYSTAAGLIGYFKVLSYESDQGKTAIEIAINTWNVK